MDWDSAFKPVYRFKGSMCIVYQKIDIIPKTTKQIGQTWKADSHSKSMRFLQRNLCLIFKYNTEGGWA